MGTRRYSHKTSKTANTHKKVGVNGHGTEKHTKKGSDRAGSEVMINFENTVNSSINIGTGGGREKIEKEYREEMEKVGRVSTVKSELVAIRGYVNETLWNKKNSWRWERSWILVQTFV
jgi:hypothetical protein